MGIRISPPNQLLSKFKKVESVKKLDLPVLSEITMAESHMRVSIFSCYVVCCPGSTCFLMESLKKVLLDTNLPFSLCLDQW